MELTVASHVEPFSGESIKRQKPRNTSVRNLGLVMCLSKIEKVVKDAGMICEKTFIIMQIVSFQIFNFGIFYQFSSY